MNKYSDSYCLYPASLQHWKSVGYTANNRLNFFMSIEKRILFWYYLVTTLKPKKEFFYMTHSTPSAFGLQSLLFSKEELSSCFFRDPTNRELEFMSYFHGIQSLLSSDEFCYYQYYRYQVQLPHSV